MPGDERLLPAGQRAIDLRRPALELVAHLPDLAIVPAPFGIALELLQAAAQDVQWLFEVGVVGDHGRSNVAEGGERRQSRRGPPFRAADRDRCRRPDPARPRRPGPRPELAGPPLRARSAPTAGSANAHVDAPVAPEPAPRSAARRRARAPRAGVQLSASRSRARSRSRSSAPIRAMRVIWGIRESPAELHLGRAKGLVVVCQRRLNRVVVGQPGLDHDPAGPLAAARPPGDLRQEAIGLLHRAKIRKPEQRVGGQDRRRRNPGEVVPLREHLRADQEVASHPFGSARGWRRRRPPCAPRRGPERPPAHPESALEPPPRCARFRLRSGRAPPPRSSGSAQELAATSHTSGRAGGGPVDEKCAAGRSPRSESPPRTPGRGASASSRADCGGGSPGPPPRAFVRAPRAASRRRRSRRAAARCARCAGPRGFLPAGGPPPRARSGRADRACRDPPRAALRGSGSRRPTPPLRPPPGTCTSARSRP